MEHLSSSGWLSDKAICLGWTGKWNLIWLELGAGINNLKLHSVPFQEQLLTEECHYFFIVSFFGWFFFFLLELKESMSEINKNITCLTLYLCSDSGKFFFPPVPAQLTLGSVLFQNVQWVQCVSFGNVSVAWGLRAARSCLMVSSPASCMMGQGWLQRWPSQ